MVARRFDPKQIQVRQVKFMPQDLASEPSDPQDLIIHPDIQTVLANLFGQTGTGGILIGAFGWGALKVACYGTGFTVYDTKADTAPASYSAAYQLAAASGYWHRIDVLVETQEAVIRFYNDATQVWGDDIPLTVGYHSIAFTTSNVQIKKRGAVAGTYTLIGFQ